MKKLLTLATLILFGIPDIAQAQRIDRAFGGSTGMPSAGVAGQTTPGADPNASSEASTRHYSDCGVFTSHNNPVCSGADPTYTNDSTTAFQDAVNAGGTVMVPPGHYKISSTVTIPANVSLIAMDNQSGSTLIEGDFDGFDFTWNGTGGHLIRGIEFRNTYYGASQGAAGIFKLQGTTGPDKLEDDSLTFKDTGVLGNNVISTTFLNVYASGDSGTDNFSRCYSGTFRNGDWFSGRAYGCNVAYDIAGDANVFVGVNAEFNNIEFRTQALDGFTVLESYLETSGMLWTNATTLPAMTYNSSTPWTDNNGNGVGWAGTVRFEDNFINFGTNGTANGQGAPLIVIKSQPNMSGRLVLEGNTIINTASKFATVSSSFNYTVAAAQVSGTKIFNWDAGITLPSVPTDSYTAWHDYTNGLTIYGGGSVGINSPTVKISGASVSPTYNGLVGPIGGSTLAAGACASGSVSIAGVTANMAVFVSGDTYDPGGNYMVRGLTGRDRVTVYVCAVAAGTPRSQQYFVRVQ